MKRLLLLLVFVSLAFSIYDDPPLSAVNAQNRLRATELSDSFNEEEAQVGSIPIDWYERSLAINASMKIAGMTLLIDNATSAGQGAGVIVEKGGRMGHPAQRSGVGICDKAFFGHYGDSSECDFDGDGCAEYEYSGDIFYDIDIIFVFGGMNETASAREESVGVFGQLFDNALANTVSVPDGMDKAMENSSGMENLTVILNGTATFVYGVDDRVPAGMSCISRYGVVSQSMHFTENATYPVEGKNKLLFTTAPLLNEQWFRNNRFDNIVLSQSRIYEAGIYRNGELAGNFTLYSFNITTNEFGLSEIVSIPMNDSGNFIGVVNVTPVQLQESSNAHAFLYKFSYGYEGMGRNELTLAVKDFFGGGQNITQNITSRQLSYDSNRTETGSAYDAATARTSASFSIGSLRLIEIGLGMLGVLIMLLLIYQIKR
ncbi:hypothetical protein H0O02_00635 [Candidatus Micrarchaeota archaeon]|nr:hypothetical protein [Candidatus Micrarchaeota archaeon]